MVIGIDASRYGHKHATGVEKYSYEIIGRLYKHAKEQGHEVRLYVREMLADFPEEDQVLIKRKKLWTLIGLSSKMMWNKPDVLFVPSHVLPLIRPKKTVIMIHDVAFNKYPKVYSWKQRRYLKWSTKYAVKHASKILVPSEFTGEELKELYKCSAKKIEVVHHGVSEFADFTDEEKGKVLKKFDLSPRDKYMFFVGRLEFKKNLPRLVRAFAGLLDNDWKLVLGGKGGYGVEEVFKTAQSLAKRDHVIFTDYLDEKEKAILLKNASMFVFPSLYEGFGLPLLEAFKAGVPVLASDIPPLKEIGGKACYYVAPLDESDIAQGINEVVRDSSMQERMIKMGRERLSKFSWQTATEKTFVILEGAVK